MIIVVVSTPNFLEQSTNLLSPTDWLIGRIGSGDRTFRSFYKVALLHPGKQGCQSLSSSRFSKAAQSQKTENIYASGS